MNFWPTTKTSKIGYQLSTLLGGLAAANSAGLEGGGAGYGKPTGRPIWEASPFPRGTLMAADLASKEGGVTLEGKLSRG